MLDEGGDVTCAGCKFDVIAGSVRYEFKSYIKATMDNIANGSIKNQHRAYIETGTLSDTKYIFEELKLGGTFTIDGVGVTAEQYVRSKFLAMYKSDPAYFWNNGSTSGWWQSVSGQIFEDSDELLNWLNSQSYSSTWLNFIKVQ